jgi:hypothetical protein
MHIEAGSDKSLDPLVIRFNVLGLKFFCGEQNAIMLKIEGIVDQLEVNGSLYSESLQLYETYQDPAKSMQMQSINFCTEKSWRKKLKLGTPTLAIISISQREQSNP